MSEKIMSVDNEFFKGVDFGGMDKLDVIFAMQEKFDQDVIKNRGLQDVTPEQWIQKQTLALLSGATAPAWAARSFLRAT